MELGLRGIFRCTWNAVGSVHNLITPPIPLYRAFHGIRSHSATLLFFIASGHYRILYCRLPDLGLRVAADTDCCFAQLHGNILLYAFLPLFMVHEPRPFIPYSDMWRKGYTPRTSFCRHYLCLMPGLVGTSHAAGVTSGCIVTFHSHLLAR